MFCQINHYAKNKALLEKDPEHRASLWHLKEHEWILQEVNQKTIGKWLCIHISQKISNDLSEVPMRDIIFKEEYKIMT